MPLWRISAAVAAASTASAAATTTEAATEAATTAASAAVGHAVYAGAHRVGLAAAGRGAARRLGMAELGAQVGVGTWLAVVVEVVFARRALALAASIAATAATCAAAASGTVGPQRFRRCA